MIHDYKETTVSLADRRGIHMNTASKATIPDIKIPAGLSTKIGLVVSAGLGVVSALTGIIDGNVDQTTIMTFAGSVAVLYQTLGGRFAQAAALLRDVPPPTDQVVMKKVKP